MALRVIEAVNTGAGSGLLAAVPVFGQTVTQQEIVTELESRNYVRGAAPATPAPTEPPPTSPTLSRSDAIAAAVTNALAYYDYSPRCATVGGCYIPDARYDYVVRLGVYYANRYLTQGSISGFGRLGQVAPVAPVIQPQPGVLPMTTGEKMAIAFQILAGGLTTAATLLQGRAERQRLQQMQQAIPDLTAAQVRTIINQAVNAGLTDKTTAQNVAAGLFDQPPPGTTPGWLLPAMAAGAAVLVMLVMKR